MKKKQDLFAILLFILIFLAVYIIITGKGHVYGSSVDWQNQHYLIPEYFRNLFYKTGDLFPDFALNLGAGQNIYYLSYYGLLSPIILVSYLLPMVAMVDYIIVSTIIMLLTSVILFYFFLRKHNYEYKVCLAVSIMFLCSGPMLFHTHCHIMFMNYMPFVILGLYGIDLFMKSKKSWLLILSIFLMIMTSYYYSVGGIVVLFIYYFYSLIKENKEEKISKIFIKSLKIIKYFIIGIMMSLILILPTLFTLLNGRDTANAGIDLAKLLVPNFDFKFLLYSSYSIGLTGIALFSLVTILLSKKRENVFLSFIIILITIFPIFNYILNGTLYIDSKSLIPFLPLALIVVCEFLTKLFSNEIDHKHFLISVLIVSIASMLSVLYIDVILLVLFLIIYNCTDKKNIMIIYLIVFAFIVAMINNLRDPLAVKTEIYSKDNEIMSELAERVSKQEESIYRTDNMVMKYLGMNKTNVNEYQTSIYSSTFNKNYNNLYYDTFNNSIPYRTRSMTVSTDNPLFQMLMGEKYIVSKGKAPIGTELLCEKGDVKVYKRENTLPVGYSTNRILNEDAYKKLKYPNNVLALLDNIIVKDATDTKYEEMLKPVDLDYNIKGIQNVKYIKDRDGYNIKADDASFIKLHINQNMQNKILFIRFKNNRLPKLKSEEFAISINGVKNKLSYKSWRYYNKNQVFDYVLYNANDLKIKFNKGSYDISDIQFYVVDYADVSDLATTVDKFIVDKHRTVNDTIVGNIDSKSDGYFVLSIPYDKGFKIYVDSKLVDYEKVNTSFIGFKINKGHHNIRVVYEAPFKKIGLIGSISGLVMYIVVIILERRRRIV